VDGHGRSQHKLVRTLTGHAHRINALALSCDNVLRTGYFEFGPSKDRDYSSMPLEELQAKASERYLSVIGSNNGGERLVSCSDDFTMFLWQPQVGKEPITRMTGHQQLVNFISFSPDSRFIASASFDKKVKIWCGKTGRFLGSCDGHVGAVYHVAWSADSAYVVSASKDSTVKLWAVKSPKKAVCTLPGHEDEVYSLDWSPNGTQVASGSKDRTIKIWRH
jgi:ribosome assembly protein 4